MPCLLRLFFKNELHIAFTLMDTLDWEEQSESLSALSQAQKKLVRDKIQAVSSIVGASLPAVTPHQAAVLSKKMVLVKRYSATEAMQIHAAATAESLAGSDHDFPQSQVDSNCQ